MSSPTSIHLEDVIRDLGGCGRFQIILVFIVHAMKCVVCFTMVAMVFGAAVPDWWCMDDLIGQNTSDVIWNNDLPQFQSCSSGNGTKVCSNFLYDDSMRTVVTEWDLLCGQAWITQTITSIQMAGVLAGNLLCGQIADLIGRKTPLYSAVAALVLLNILAVFSTSWVMFTVIRFFLGLSMGFYLTVNYNLLSEFTMARWRAWSVAVPSWPVELALFAFVAWLLKDWKFIHVATACIGVPLLATWCFVPESFRWHVSHDKFEHAEKTIKYIGKVNGHENIETDTLKRLVVTEKSEDQAKKSDKKYTILHILRHKRLLKLSLILCWMWISLGLSGYGIQFGVQKLSGDLYLNIFIIGIIGVPFSFIVIYLCNRLGRRKTAWLFYFLSSTTAVVVGIAQYLEDQETGKLLANICAISSLTFINVAWSAMQIMTIEVYPTVVRNIGYGTQNIMARVGSIIGPQLVFLGTLVPGLLYFICALAGVLTMVLLIFVPETNNKDLQDLLVEVEITVCDKDRETNI